MAKSMKKIYFDQQILCKAPIGWSEFTKLSLSHLSFSIFTVFSYLSLSLSLSLSFLKSVSLSFSLPLSLKVCLRLLSFRGFPFLLIFSSKGAALIGSNYYLKQTVSTNSTLRQKFGKLLIRRNLTKIWKNSTKFYEIRPKLPK